MNTQKLIERKIEQLTIDYINKIVDAGVKYIDIHIRDADIERVKCSYYIEAIEQAIKRIIRFLVPYEMQSAFIGVLKKEFSHGKKEDTL